jgi:hypothetical protein
MMTMKTASPTFFGTLASVPVAVFSPAVPIIFYFVTTAEPSRYSEAGKLLLYFSRDCPVFTSELYLSVV